MPKPKTPPPSAPKASVVGSAIGLGFAVFYGVIALGLRSHLLLYLGSSATFGAAFFVLTAALTRRDLINTSEDKVRVYALISLTMPWCAFLIMMPLIGFSRWLAVIMTVAFLAFFIMLAAWGVTVEGKNVWKTLDELDRRGEQPTLEGSLAMAERGSLSARYPRMTRVMFGLNIVVRLFRLIGRS